MQKDKIDNKKLFYFFLCLLSVAVFLTLFDRINNKISPVEFVFSCINVHNEIKKKLLSPSTAEFPHCIYAVDQHDTVLIDNNNFRMYGYVDSQNIYSAQIRQKWWANVHKISDVEFKVVESGIGY